MAQIDLSVLIQGAMLAAIIWYGRKVVTVSEVVAVHGEKHRSHNRRLEILEGKL